MDTALAETSWETRECLSFPRPSRLHLGTAGRPEHTGYSPLEKTCKFSRGKSLEPEDELYAPPPPPNNNRNRGNSANIINTVRRHISRAGDCYQYGRGRPAQMRQLIGTHLGRTNSIDVFLQTNHAVTDSHLRSYAFHNDQKRSELRGNVNSSLSHAPG